MKFRKKQVVVEAFKLNENYPERTFWPDWFHDAVSECKITTRRIGPDEGPFSPSKITAEIKTLEGVMLANAGDYIIKGVAGEFYPCKPDIFEATYEVVE
jgi:hypothetical protein